MMYPKFIELHWNTIPVSYNVENISWFGNKFLYIVGQDISLDVDESYDELKALITDCGCYINKGDPRLDLTHPLTMDDLMTMVGEPVWNSNIGEWGLITKDPVWHDETHPDWKRQSGYYLRYHDDTITRFDEDDLKKFPLYRMKR